MRIVPPCSTMKKRPVLSFGCCMSSGACRPVMIEESPREGVGPGDGDEIALPPQPQARPTATRRSSTSIFLEAPWPTGTGHEMSDSIQAPDARNYRTVFMFLRFNL